MSIMALFNTLHRKREKNFLSVCKTFKKEGVETIEAAESCRKVMLSNAKVYVMFVLMVGLSLAMLFQSVYLPILVGMGILLLYILTSVYRARELAQRYIDEVLKDPEFIPYSQREEADDGEQGGVFGGLFSDNKPAGVVTNTEDDAKDEIKTRPEDANNNEKNPSVADKA